MKQRVSNQLPNNLPQLQNLIKRDRVSYYEEFTQQQRHFQSRLEVFRLEPTKHSKSLEELVMFLAQVSHCFPKELCDYPQTLMDLLTNYSTVLDRDMRLTFCRALIMMRNKSLLEPTTLLELFFRLLNCHDKGLRSFLQIHIVTDIKNINSKHKNAKLNATLQNFMFGHLADSNTNAAKMALDIMIDLYGKHIWNDSKTVNVIATALFSKITKVMVGALKFFLGKDEDGEEAGDKESDSEDSDKDAAKGVNSEAMKAATMATRVNKKSRKRQKQLFRARHAAKKQSAISKAPAFNFSALHLVYDPQTLAEKLMSQLERMTERFEVKLLTMNLLSRLVGVHQLFVFNFYPFLQHFLRPHQREVTRLLTYAAQSAHELVPPYVLEPLLKTLADNFVEDCYGEEVVAVGLNSIRELCARCPLVMNAELLSDLVRYKNSKHKSIAIAARSLLQLFRLRNPELLRKRDRGKPMASGDEFKVLAYGQSDAHDYVAGAEVLPEVVEEKTKENDEEWESASEEEDGGSEEEDGGSEDGWIDVQHSSDEEVEAVSTELNAMTAEERAQKAALASQYRVFNQEEQEKIGVARLAKMLVPAKAKGSAKKRKATDPSPASLLERKELVALSEIERVHKKPKHDKESRLASMMAGREGREKFAGGRPARMNPHASTNNKEKSKKKAFAMIKHKVKKKIKRSFREKQIALRNSLLKNKKMK